MQYNYTKIKLTDHYGFYINIINCNCTCNGCI